MKKTIVSLLSGAAMLAAVTSSYGQGQVQFQNNSTSSPVVYGPGAPVGAPTPGTGVSGAANTYTYGLYIGASTATTLSQMTLIDTTGNATVVFAAGSITGGTVTGSGNVGLANGFGGLVAGTTYDFIVAAWTTSAGANFAAALQNATATTLTGMSALGMVVPTATTGSSGATQLFGTGAGQIGGFSIQPMVPEPSTIVLGGLGAAALLAFRRRK